MDFENRQEELDCAKWYDSMVAGEDRCGSYDFCAKCHKNETEPCARAEYRYRHGYIRIAVIRRRRG